MSGETQTAAQSKSRFVPVGIALIAALAYGGYRLHLARQPYEWSGTVEARTIAIGSRAGGRVKEVLVREGDRVTAGQVLVRLEAGDWLAQLLQAEGQLTQVQAMLEKVKRGARPEEIEQARARVATAKAALDEAVAGPRPEQVAAAQSRLEAQAIAVEKAELDARRIHKLAESGAAARVDVDNADIGLKSALAQRDALAHQYDEMKNGSRREQLAQAKAREVEQYASERLVSAGARVEDIKAAQGSVDAARGRVDQIKSMVDELAIRASVAARVEALELRPGDILAANATAVTLLEDEQLYVRIYVPETQLGHIQVGQRVPVTVDSFPGQSFEGTVEHINNRGEYSPRNLQTADERADQVFATRIGIISGRDQLRAGMAAFIRVPK